MTLQWVRLDANIGTHDKILRLVARREGWRAYGVYTFSLGYAGSHGTDGFVPETALPFIHGTQKHAELLVEHDLWEPIPGGWSIHNFAHRQELSLVTATREAARRLSAAKANCVRWHGPDCGCWQRDGA